MKSLKFRVSYIVAILATSLLFCSCTAKKPVFKSSGANIFSSAKQLTALCSAKLDEVSGIVASVANRDCFWVHNDKGDSANLYLIDYKGDLVATVRLNGVENRDWEDIAYCDGYLYVGEIGDNDAKYRSKFIYKIKEPNVSVLSANKQFSVDVDETMEVVFSNGSRDCETLMVDPISEEVVLILKRESSVYLYSTPFVDGSVEISPKAALPFTYITAGDISHTGEEILIKNRTTVYYWSCDGRSVVETLQSEATKLPYTQEPQGEAICWGVNDVQYYTISEKRYPTLYYYQKR